MSSGLRNFPLDTVLNDKLKLLEAEYGLKGFAVIVKLFQHIYGTRGYYAKWDLDVGLLFVKENAPEAGWTLVSEIVDCALRRGVFDMSLYKQYGILTSGRIQETFLYATNRRTKVELEKKYLLPDAYSFIDNVDSSSKNVRKNLKIVDSFQQKKRDEMKRKETIDDSAPARESPPAALSPSSFNPNRAKELCQQYAPTYFKADHAYSKNDFQAFYETVDDPEDPLMEDSLIKLLQAAERSEFIGTWKVVTLKGLLNNRQRILNGDFKELFNKQQPSQFEDFERTQYSKEELAGLYADIGKIDRL